ncbi:MAG: dihydroxyacetone kinase subunit DhaK [Christensenellaceae bacterium]|nr:dihydroxyacetone kinase subunit DhaK [Christensenellaceae bacterium]
MRNKFYNDAETITDEMLEGLALVMSDYIDVDGHIISRKGFKDDDTKRVTCVTLGGSGHEPSSFGFCGKGWECIKVVGDVFAAPSPAAVLEGLLMADKGKGILLYAGNHAGDVLSATLAKKMAHRKGIKDIELVIFYDDISSFPREQKEERRGMGCSLGLGKVIGSACDSGRSLAEVKAAAEKFIDNTASLAVATRGATHPVTGKKISDIPEGKMVIGMGQHGEGANKPLDMLTSSKTAKIMCERLIDDLSLKAGERVYVLVNGSGGATYMELMIVYKDVVKYLSEQGISVEAKLVGEFLTTQEQSGFQLSITRLDDELSELLKMPCDTAFKRQL